MRLIFLLLFLAASLFATDYNGEIFTWGYGEILKNILDAIRALVAGGGLAIIFKSAMGIAFLLFAFKKAADSKTNPTIEFGKLMLLAVAVWYLFLNAPNDAKHRYIITDKVTGDQYVVEQVPTGIGEPLQLITDLEDKIIGAMEKEFSLPNSLTYRESGFGFPLEAQSVLTQLKSPDIYFQRTFKEFIQNCTLYEIQDGSKDLNTIMTSNDLLTALDPNGDTRLTKVYNAANPDGEVEMCKDAYSYIRDYITNTELDRQMAMAAALAATKDSIFQDRLDSVPYLFFNSADNARSYLQQNFVINMTKSAFKNIGATTGISGSQLAYSTAVAEQNLNNKFIVGGFLAKDYLPIIKGVLLAIIVALSWILALLAVVFMDFKYIKMYFTLLFWLFMWSPILVIINYVGDIYISHIFTNVAEDTGQAYTMFTNTFVNDKVSSALAWLGYLIWLTPILAYSIVKASEHGFVMFASTISGLASSGASAGASTNTAQAQSTEARMRYGDKTYTEMAGGGYNVQSQHTYGGHAVDSSVTTMGGGAVAYAYNYDRGVVNLSATSTGGQVTGFNVNSEVANARVSNSIKAQMQQMLSHKQSYAQQAANDYTSAVQGSIREGISENKSFSMNTSEVTSKSEREALNKQIISSLDKSISHSKGHEEFFQDLSKIDMSGQIGFEVKKIAGGGMQVSVTDNKGHTAKTTLSEQEAQKFQDIFSEQFSQTLATNEEARNAYSHLLQATHSKDYSQIASVTEKYNEAYNDLIEAQKNASWIKDHSGVVSANALNLLAEDIYNDIKARNPNMPQADLLEATGSELTDIIEKGRLNEELENRGIFKKILEEKNAISNSVDNTTDKVEKGIESGKKNAEISSDGVKHTREEVKENDKRISGVVDNNQKSPDELKAAFDKEKATFNKDKEDAMGGFKYDKDKLDGVDTELNNSLLENFAHNHPWITTALSAVAVGLGGKMLAPKIKEYFAAKFKEDPMVALDELKQLENKIQNGGNVRGYLEKTDPKLLQYLESNNVKFNNAGMPLIEDMREIKEAGNVITMSGAKSISKEIVEEAKDIIDAKVVSSAAGDITNPLAAKDVVKAADDIIDVEVLKNSKFATARTLLEATSFSLSLFVDGTPLSPTTISDGDFTATGKFKGFAKDDDWLTPNEVRLVYQNTNGTYSAVDTDVNYKEFQEWLSNNPAKAKEMMSYLDNRVEIAPGILENLETPEQLYSYVKDYTGHNEFAAQQQLESNYQSQPVTDSLQSAPVNNTNIQQAEAVTAAPATAHQPVTSTTTAATATSEQIVGNSNAYQPVTGAGGGASEWKLGENNARPLTDINISDLTGSWNKTQNSAAYIHHKSFAGWEGVIGDQRKDIYTTKNENELLKKKPSDFIP